jgi:hypothetical protein
MEIETIATADLVLDPNNANGHEKGIPEIAASLNEFGQQKPLVVWGENIVIAGNGTLEAARVLGLTSMNISRVPADWTYERAQAFALADNQVSKFSEWKLPLLTDQLDSLETAGWDMERFGFDDLPVLTLGDASQGGSKGLGTPIIHYDIIFDTDDQQRLFFEFMKYLRRVYPHSATNAERLIEHVVVVLDGQTAVSG